MFNTDLAIYGLIKKAFIKLCPIFKVTGGSIPAGGLMADVVIILIVAFGLLSKVQKNQDKLRHSRRD